MSDVSKITSEQPSLIEEFIQSSDPVLTKLTESIESASSTDELKDKLSILENAANNQQLKTMAHEINQINELINNGSSIESIKSQFRN
tara:strand:- start:174 stop:437 length:264 start_codon:yes stop_codon:yes gene_type:complete